MIQMENGDIICPRICEITRIPPSSLLPMSIILSIGTYIWGKDLTP